MPWNVWNDSIVVILKIQKLTKTIFRHLPMAKILARILFSQLLNNVMIWALSESFVTLNNIVQKMSFLLLFRKRKVVGSIFLPTLSRNFTKTFDIVSWQLLTKCVVVWKSSLACWNVVGCIIVIPHGVFSLSSLKTEVRLWNFDPFHLLCKRMQLAAWKLMTETSDTHTGHPGIMGYKVVTRDSGIGDYAHESLQMIVDSPVRI